MPACDGEILLTLPLLFLAKFVILALFTIFVNKVFLPLQIKSLLLMLHLLNSQLAKRPLCFVTLPLCDLAKFVILAVFAGSLTSCFFAVDETLLFLLYLLNLRLAEGPLCLCHLRLFSMLNLLFLLCLRFLSTRFLAVEDKFPVSTAKNPKWDNSLKTPQIGLRSEITTDITTRH